MKFRESLSVNISNLIPSDLLMVIEQQAHITYYGNESILSKLDKVPSFHYGYIHGYKMAYMVYNILLNPKSREEIKDESDVELPDEMKISINKNIDKILFELGNLVEETDKMDLYIIAYKRGYEAAYTVYADNH
jgi:hypothetical protein